MENNAIPGELTLNEFSDITLKIGDSVPENYQNTCRKSSTIACKTLVRTFKQLVIKEFETSSK